MEKTEWIRLAQSTCERAGFEPRSMDVLATWDELYCANAVYRLDESHYLKIFGPRASWQFHVERSALTIVAGDPGIPAPRVLGASREGEEPPFLILSGIDGATAEDVWDDLSRSVQLDVARQLGSLAARIHRLPVDDLALVEERTGSREIQLRRIRKWFHAGLEAAAGFTEAQRQALRDFSEGPAAQIIALRDVLTHYDMAHNHFYLLDRAGRKEVSGIIDWGEAVLGPAEWDLVYLWFWTFTRDREAMRACLDAYFGAAQRPSDFARRCLAALFYTPSIGLLWESLTERGIHSRDIVEEVTAVFFPEEVFGAP